MGGGKQGEISLFMQYKRQGKTKGENQGEYEIMINEKQKTTCNARNKNRSGR